MTDKLSAIHPGEVLLEEFIKPLNLSQNRLAIDIGVDARRINEIVLGKRAVTANTTLRLSRFFGNSPKFWLGLQSQYDLDIAEDLLGKWLDKMKSDSHWIAFFISWQALLSPPPSFREAHL